jgi:ankyrin repeat protein
MDKGDLNTWLLWEALREGDVLAAQRAVENGADPDTDFAGETALHWAVENDYPSLVRVLLDHGCDPSPHTAFYEHTPLHWAADHGHTSIAEMLIEAGAEIEARTNGGWTPLHTAVAQNASEVVGLLLEKGADIDAQNDSDETVLHFVQNTDPQLYTFLLENTEDADPRDEHGATPMTYAAAHGRIDLVELLMDHGASTQSVDRYGNSPADMARQEGHRSLADFIEHPPEALNDENLRQINNEFMTGAFHMLLPYLEFGENKPVESESDKNAVRRAVEMLERVTRINPYNWSALWFLGLAHRVLGDQELEYQALKRAYEMEQSMPYIARELSLACIALGKGEEAVRVTRDALSLQPDDAGLVANHSLALLIAGQVQAAEITVSRSLQLDPTDTITIRLQKLIQAVREGRLPRPTKWPQSTP